MERPRILLVDDRPQNLLALQATLGELPVDCVEATSGQEAVRLAEESDFAVVLLDVQMPDMDGFATADALRRSSRKTPIIFLTAMHKDESHVLSGYACGAVDYGLKPFEPEILVGKVKVFVELYEQRQVIQRQAVRLGEHIRRLEEAREDIRSKEELLEELYLAKEEADVASRAKSDFLANMSHELRTPLHGILSFSRFGIKKASTAERDKLREYFEQIEGSGDTLLSLLNDLLDLAKLQAGKMTLSVRAVDLRVLALAVIEELRICAAHRRLTITCGHPDVELMALVDSDRIKQVVRNLLSNSIKFSTDGGRIHVEFQRNEDSIDVSLRDEGIGIPEDELGAVFEKFVQSSKTKSGAGGTGLGLAICREILAAHGGSIWAQNDPAGGAVFTFRLPVSWPALCRNPESDRRVEAVT